MLWSIAFLSPRIEKTDSVPEMRQNARAVVYGDGKPKVVPVLFFCCFLPMLKKLHH